MNAVIEKINTPSNLIIFEDTNLIYEIFNWCGDNFTISILGYATDETTESDYIVNVDDENYSFVNDSYYNMLSFDEKETFLQKVNDLKF